MKNKECRQFGSSCEPSRCGATQKNTSFFILHVNDDGMPKWREDPSKVRPMLASLDSPPIAHHGYLYEPKYDGIRALVDLRPPHGKAGPHVVIYSRNGHDKTRQFPAIAGALSKIATAL
jgi:hypothetical protein